MNDLIGKTVSWTAVSKRGRAMSMRLREGTVTAVNGDVATVETSRNRTVDVAITRLRLPGEVSQITEFVEGVRQAAAAAKGN